MKIYIASLLLIALTISGLGLKAQEIAPLAPVDEDTKLITYKEVVQVPGNAGELFNRAIEWLNTQYKNPADATKVRNPATGLIEIIHRIEITKEDKGMTRAAGVVDYSMKLEMKEGRYRYTITNFNFKDMSRKPIEFWMDKKDKAYNPEYENYLKQVNDFTMKLIESLKKGMLPPLEKKPDEW